MRARSVGDYTEPFRSTHIENLKSTRLGFGVYLRFGVVSQVVSLLITIVAGDLERIIAIETSPTSGARRADTSDGGRAFSTLLSISTTLLPLLHLPSLFTRVSAILGPRGIWMQGA